MVEFIVNGINKKQGSLKRFVSGDFTQGKDNSVIEWEVIPDSGKYIEIQSIKANVGYYIVAGEKKMVAEIWGRVDPNTGQLTEDTNIGVDMIINQSVYITMDDLAAECDDSVPTLDTKVYYWIYNDNDKQLPFELHSKYNMKYRLYVSDYNSSQNADGTYPLASDGLGFNRGTNPDTSSQDPIGIRILIKGLIYDE